ncbi:MAG TPA: fasciclin domain-containing protein [Gemmatimonadales bacterium]
MTGLVTTPSETTPGETAPTAGTRSVIATATAAGSFNTFVAASKTAGLTETLEGNGPFTVFAPTDAAFAKLPKDKLDALLKDQVKLKAILSYHVLPGNYAPAQLAKLTSAKTLNGKTLKIAAKDGKVWADNGQVTLTDMAATNGGVYAIDTVLMPN